MYKGVLRALPGVTATKDLDRDGEGVYAVYSGYRREAHFLNSTLSQAVGAGTGRDAKQGGIFPGWPLVLPERIYKRPSVVYFTLSQIILFGIRADCAPDMSDLTVGAGADGEAFPHSSKPCNQLLWLPTSEATSRVAVLARLSNSALFDNFNDPWRWVKVIVL